MVIRKRKASENKSPGPENLRGRKKMTAGTLMFFIIPIVVILLFSPLSCIQSSPVNDDQYAEQEEQIMPDRVIKTDEEWQRILTPEQYEITRQKGTEPPFTGEYYKFTEKGIYKCVACGNDLFSSEAKYDSGSGWPSFWRPVSDTSIESDKDNSRGMVRVEVMCNRCSAHLGHVFEDGPPPSGQRYCINSVALDFVADDEE